MDVVGRSGASTATEGAAGNAPGAKAARHRGVRAAPVSPPAAVLNRPQPQSLNELRTLHAITRRITAHLDLEATLPEITRSAVELLDGAAGVLVLWDDRHQVYRDTAIYNLPQELLGQPIPKSAKISVGAYIVENSQPLIVDDYTGDPRSVPMLRAYGFKATVGVPLLSQDNAIGALIVLSTDPARRYDQHDVELLSAFADQATVAIENALLYAKERERVRQIVIAQEQERRKIARELHDEICQALLNLLMESSLYERDAAAPEARAWFREHTAGLRQTLEMTRGVLADLRNVALETLGLLGAIETELLPRWRRGTSCEVRFEQRDWPQGLPFDLSLQIYRVLQEALNNVKKHACANEVRILLERQQSKLTLTVTDDGVGFDPTAEADRADGWVRVGLEGMRERAGLLSAQLEVLSRPGAGTVVRLSIPYPQRPVSAAEPSDPLDILATNP